MLPVRRSGFVALAFAGALATHARAQVSTIAATAPTLTAVAAWNVRADSTFGRSANLALANSISLMVSSGAAQTIAGLVSGSVNAFPSPVQLTTQWQLNTLVSTVDLVGYFQAPGAALSSGTSSIASQLVEGRMQGGLPNAFTPFTQSSVAGQGVAGATLHLYRQLIVAAVNGTGQRQDQLELRLNLQGKAALVPGTYQGTLTLRATAY